MDAAAAYFAKNDAKLALRAKPTKAAITEQRRASIKKAQEAKRIKMAQREMVRRKIENAQPITEQERELLKWKGGNRAGQTEDQLVMAAAAKLMIKPQSVSELRLLVETTAAKNNYNPIEKLIHLTSDPNVTEAEKISIHKALLPFLVPILATPKALSEKGEGGVKVVITSFSFDPKRPEAALHTEKPVTVATTQQ